MELGGTRLDPPVALAPMAGITDRPFRQLVARFGVGWVVSEMVASQEVVQGRPLARARAELGLDDSRTAVQLAGRTPYWMGEAARMAEANGARIIDINMGCPAKKVTGGQSGAALMREPARALRLIEAVVGAVRVPVTLKMRLGWDAESLNAADLARCAEAAGVAMITVHGRTRCQFYTGRPDWHAIGAVRAAVGIPVIANGDITDEAGARAALVASGAAGVMIGRGVRGRPWLPGRIAAALRATAPPPPPDDGAFHDMIAEHYEAMLRFYGTALGVRVARKHLAWYLDTAQAPAALRRPVLTAHSPAEVLRALRGALADAPGLAA